MRHLSAILLMTFCLVGSLSFASGGNNQTVMDLLAHDEGKIDLLPIGPNYYKLTLAAQIVGVEQYRNVITQLGQLTHKDTVVVIISDNMGGDLAGTVALSKALNSTFAHVEGHVVGLAASGAAFLTCALPTVTFSGDSHLWFHAGQLSGDHKYGDALQMMIEWTNLLNYSFQQCVDKGYITQAEVVQMIDHNAEYTIEPETMKLSNRVK